MRRAPFAEERARVLAGARGRVLEIGVGTGLNLPHYPAHIDHLTVVDPNPGMNAKAQQRAAAVAFPVEHRALSAESLPFDADSFDCITCAWTLCSIADVEGALYEMRRVLKPGGLFFCGTRRQSGSDGAQVAGPSHAAATPDRRWLSLES